MQKTKLEQLVSGEKQKDINKGLSNQSSKRRFLIVKDGITNIPSNMEERQLTRTHESLNIVDELISLGRQESLLPKLSESHLDASDEVSEHPTIMESKKQLPILKKPMGRLKDIIKPPSLERFDLTKNSITIKTKNGFF